MIQLTLSALTVHLPNFRTSPAGKFGTSTGKGCFKIRLAISSKNKGKSDGARIIICVKIHDEIITLISIYDKSEQAAIPSKILLQLLEDSQLI